MLELRSTKMTGGQGCRVKSLSKGANSNKDVFSSTNLRVHKFTLPSISSAAPLLKDDVGNTWSQQIQEEDYGALEGTYEQVKPPAKRNTLEEKPRKVNGEAKSKDMPKVEPKNSDSDDDINELLQVKAFCMDISG